MFLQFRVVMETAITNVVVDTCFPALEAVVPYKRKVNIIFGGGGVSAVKSYLSICWGMTHLQLEQK